MGVGMKDYTKLDNYLIPKIVPSIYRIGLILCIIVGLIQILENSWYYGDQYTWMDGLLSGIIWIVIIPLILRIICEALLMLYEINQTLLNIKSNITPQDDKQNQTENET